MAGNISQIKVIATARRVGRSQSIQYIPGPPAWGVLLIAYKRFFGISTGISMNHPCVLVVAVLPLQPKQMIWKEYEDSQKNLNC